MRALGFVFIGIAWLLALLVHRIDARMQAHRSAGTPEREYRLLPHRLFDPTLYDDRGQALQETAVRVLAGVLVCFLVGALLVAGSS